MEQKQKLHRYLLFVALELLVAMIFSCRGYSQSIIRMKTTSPIDSELRMAIRADGDIKIKGLQGSWINNIDKRVRYTVSNQEIEIEGKVLEIDCHKMKLSSLEVSNCPTLETLVCYENNLETIDVTRNKALRKIDIAKNSRIQVLDITQNELLEKLECDETLIENLDVSHNPKMIRLKVSKCKLKRLDLSNNPDVEAVWCDFNNISEINIQGKQKLHTLWCDNNRITELVVTDCPSLRLLGCNANNLKNLTFKNSKEITKLWCNNNQLTTLDVSGLPQLTLLYCHVNQLTELNVSCNTELRRFWLFGNQIKGKAMTQLVKSMPDLRGKELKEEKYDKDGAFVVVENKIKTAQNECSTQDIELLTKKMWTAYDYNGDFPNKIVYAGGPVGIDLITDINQMQITTLPDGIAVNNAPYNNDIFIYSIDGSLVAQTNADTQGYAKINLGSKPYGIYLVKIGKFSKKIFVQ